MRRCPTCGEPLASSRPDFGPFCSARCQLLDLGAWLTDGERAIPGPAADAGPPSPEPDADPEP